MDQTGRRLNALGGLQFPAARPGRTIALATEERPAVAGAGRSQSHDESAREAKSALTIAFAWIRQAASKLWNHSTLLLAAERAAVSVAPSEALASDEKESSGVGERHGEGLLVLVVLDGTEADDERDPSFLEIAEAPSRARLVPVHRPASAPPIVGFVLARTDAGP